MKHTSSTPPKEERRPCGLCNSKLPASLLRQVRKDQPAYVCRNQAACRKRQRQNARGGTRAS